MNEKGPLYWDRAGRLWITCPKCGRKTPAWALFGVSRQGECRWCGTKWRIANLRPDPQRGKFYGRVGDLLALKEVKVEEGWDE